MPCFPTAGPPFVQAAAAADLVAEMHRVEYPEPAVTTTVDASASRSRPLGDDPPEGVRPMPARLGAAAVDAPVARRRPTQPGTGRRHAHR